MLKVLHNPTCSKSRGILEFLDENGVPFEIIDFIAHPLSETELRTLVKKLNVPAEMLLRKNEPLFKEKFSQETLNEDRCFQILAENPSLLQRPILIKEQIAMIARPMEVAKLFIED